jgi:hypothetical protein
MTDKSERSTSIGASIQSGPDATSKSKLLRGMILQALEDAVKAKGKRQRTAMTYLCSKDFGDDCRSIGLDPKMVGQLVVKMLDLGDDDRDEEVTRLKRIVRGA